MPNVEELWKRLNGMVRQGEAAAPTSTSPVDQTVWSEAERARITKLSAPAPPRVETVEDYVAGLFGEALAQPVGSIWTDAERGKIRPMLENPPRPEPIGSDDGDRRGFMRRTSAERRMPGDWTYIPLTVHRLDQNT